MSLPSFLLHLSKDLLILTSVVGILGFSLLGVKFPFQFPVLAVGQYELAAFDSGLAFFQNNRAAHYYSMTPLNDFIINSQGFRQPLLESSQFTEKKFTTNLETSLPDKLTSALLSYFGKKTPDYRLQTEQMLVIYAVEKAQETITIHRTVTFQQPLNPQGVGTTLTYDPEDIIYDPQTHIVYSDQSEEELRVIGQLLNKPFIKNAEPNIFQTLLENKQVAIINIDLPGKLTIKALPHQTLFLNQNSRLIEVVERIDENNPNSITTKLELQIADQY